MTTAARIKALAHRLHYIPLDEVLDEMRDCGCEDIADLLERGRLHPADARARLEERASEIELREVLSGTFNGSVK